MKRAFLGSRQAVYWLANRELQKARKRGELTQEPAALFFLYCDEIQNLVAFDGGIDKVLSEARKFGIGVVSANQFHLSYRAYAGT